MKGYRIELTWLPPQPLTLYYTHDQNNQAALTSRKELADRFDIYNDAFALIAPNLLVKMLTAYKITMFPSEIKLTMED